MTKNSKANREGDKIKTAIEFLEIYYDQRIKVGDIAYEAGLSPGRLAHLFKERTGLTPIQYLTNIRIEQAKKQLLTWDDKLCKFYSEVGFNSESYFIRKFKQFVGVSPSKFRAASRGTTR